MKEHEARRHRRWRDLPRSQRTVLAITTIVQFALAAWAWADLAHRPADEVRGPKWRWALLIGINFIGPLAYLRYGRIHPLRTERRWVEGTEG